MTNFFPKSNTKCPMHCDTLKYQPHPFKFKAMSLETYIKVINNNNYHNELGIKITTTAIAATLN